MNKNYSDKRFDGLLFRSYKLNNIYLRKIIREILLQRKQAEFYSKTLRKIFLHYHEIDVGMYSYGVFYPDLPVGTVIGRYTSVAPNFLVLNGSHPTTYKSTHPFFFNPDLGYVHTLRIERRTRLFIGNDVYIGANVILTPSVTSIGNGAIIAAGSVVTKDVPAFTIVGGNTAKIIRYRFTPDIIDMLVKSRWWEKDIEELLENELEFASFLKAF